VLPTGPTCLLQQHLSGADLNSTMIDVALGLALLYGVLSLFVTTIQEYVINSGMRWRSRHMKKTVRSAFGEDKALTDAFFAHPLIVSLADGKGGRAPSYVPDDVFAKVFLAVVGHGRDPKALGMTPSAFLASVRPALAAKAGTPNGATVRSAADTRGSLDFIESLRLATSGSMGDWPAFETAVGQWFHDIGERSRGWFKRSSQRWTMAIALLIAVGLNVDSIMIARTLWGDADLRRQLADAAVAVDGVRRAAAEGASAPSSSSSTAGDTLEQGYARVQNGLNALVGRLKEGAFLQEDAFFKIRCEPLPASCLLEPVLGDHCRRPVALAASAPAACSAKQATTLVPATRWLDQVNDLASEMAAGRAGVTARGVAMRLNPELQDRIALVQRTLAAIASDMSIVRLKTPDSESKQVRTMDSLILDVQTLQEQSGQLFRFAKSAVSVNRAETECKLQFARDQRSLEACTQRRQAEQPFPLPLGFEPAVLARQMSLDDLEECVAKAGRCGTWSQLWSAALNGAVLGWLLTAIALSLGAPFWFDTLGRLVKLRASGTPSGTDADPKTEGNRKAGPTTSPAPSSAPSPAPGSAPAVAPGGTADVASKIESLLSDVQIREVQRRLQVAPTGVFDSDTRAAIAARRAALGMNGGAELDVGLYEAIIERRTSSVQQRPTLQPGQSHDLVPELRQRLGQMLGVPARVQGTGDVFDEGLRVAVRLLQGRAGLAPDGVVGEQTWRILDAGKGAAVAADAWMMKAITQLGLDETRDKHEVQKFLAVLNEGQQDPATFAWCACFVAWAVKDVGPPPPANEPTRAVSWSSWGAEISDDKYGSVVVLEETKVRVGETAQHHVALLVGKTAGGWVVLGGNQGRQGEVSVTLFPSDSHKVVHNGMPNSPATAV
jgi:uncharacterized protein (TIGR02594 family)